MAPYEAILAALLFLQPPGRSIYSQVVVSEDTPAPCSDEYNLLCQPPRWNTAHGAFTVAETPEQGAARYTTIARALQFVLDAPNASWHCREDWLWRYVATTVFHESGLRRDVHEGIGDDAMGDCTWTGPRGKRQRVPGSCKSYCLGQVLLDKRRTSEGWSGAELVGLDLESTVRCLTVVTRHVDRSHAGCRSRGPTDFHACTFATYGGLGPGGSHDPRIRERVRTFWRVLEAPTELTDGQQVLLFGVPVP